jgi:phosphoribosylaminoimidazole-succinocarboxamide synthase
LTIKSGNINNFSGESFSKDYPLDGNNYSLVEYYDYITDEKNKKIRVKGLGEKFAAINSFFMDYLKEYHIPSSFIKYHSKSVLKYLNITKYPFYIKILNITDKRTAKIFVKKERELLNLPIFEYYYDNGKDSFVSESHLLAFDLCTYEDLKLIGRLSSKINAVLKSFFERRNEILAEVKCFFGKADDKIYLIEDFTPRSLKTIAQENQGKTINPFKLTTPAQLRKYTDHLLSLTKS